MKNGGCVAPKTGPLCFMVCIFRNNYEIGTKFGTNQSLHCKHCDIIYLNLLWKIKWRHLANDNSHTKLMRTPGDNAINRHILSMKDCISATFSQLLSSVQQLWRQFDDGRLPDCLLKTRDTVARMFALAFSDFWG